MSKRFNLDDAFPEDKSKAVETEKQQNVNEREEADNKKDLKDLEEKGAKTENLAPSKTNYDESIEPKNFLNRKSVESKTYAFFMNPKDGELIKAIAEIQGRSQGEVISNLIDEFIEGKKEEVINIWEEYERRKELKNKHLF